MKVHNHFGAGFAEVVYENSLILALRDIGLQANQQSPLEVDFEGQKVGKFYVDILVDSKIILEIKSTEYLSDRHRAQTLNYCRAADLRLGMRINFGAPRLEYERIVN